MKKIILASAVLASALAMPAMADTSQGDGAQMPLGESPAGFVAHRHIAAAQRHDVEKCASYAAGEDGVHPFECVVDSGSNGSEGGSGEGDSSSY